VLGAGCCANGRFGCVSGPARNVTFAALALVVAILVVQVAGLGGLDPTINVITLALILLIFVLGYAIATPAPVVEALTRITTFKVSGVFEIGLQAANRAERVQARLPSALDEVETSPRPRDGDPHQEYEAVREKLQARLRFIRKDLFELPATQNYEQIVGNIEERRLLDDDELHLVRDILGELEKEVGRLPESLQKEYLDANWRFAVRFGTLVFERLVRRKMTEAGWFIVNFDQARSHRPDFLAFKDGSWQLLATRLEPENRDGTRTRLARLNAPFGATAAVVSPDSRAVTADDNDTQLGACVIPLSEVLKPRVEAPA